MQFKDVTDGKVNGFREKNAFWISAHVSSIYHLGIEDTETTCKLQMFLPSHYWFIWLCWGLNSSYVIWIGIYLPWETIEYCDQTILILLNIYIIEVNIEDEEIYKKL